MSGEGPSGQSAAADAVHDARELLNGILDEMNAGYRAVPNTERAATGDTADGDAPAPPPKNWITLNGVVALATELAELVIRVGGKLAIDAATAAAEFATLIVRRAGDGSLADPLRLAATGAGDTTAPPVLVLADVSPGGTTTGRVSVRNDSLDMVDGMRLRCSGLFGPGEERILGYRLDFSPAVVDVHPRSSANVACSLAVPPTTKRARYFGVIEAAGTPGVQLLVSLNVI